MKKISVSVAAAAVLAMTAVTGAVSAELPAYEKAGLPVSAVKNNKGVDVLAMVKKLREKHHLVIDPGYGPIRGKTFRLSNMGDETEESVAHLLSCLDDCLS